MESAVGKEAADAALDLLELVEYAWHDCYGEVTPPEEIVDDILTCAQGDLAEMIRFALMAVEDSRDLHVAARQIEADGTP
ncbi:hypothetical protein [Streptomyces sp. NBC_00690]|uniref:hypothetical protein n=1 Tax=Streptomyces sp. NBC_00690 TaxID=2975808 RepID=UPI002E292FB4|nr:hypothetical protein [Streptomyces sp. NBC_00690]